METIALSSETSIPHALSAWAARRDPLFVDVARRHLKYPVWMRP